MDTTMEKQEMQSSSLPPCNKKAKIQAPAKKDDESDEDIHGRCILLARQIGCYLSVMLVDPVGGLGLRIREKKLLVMQFVSIMRQMDPLHARNYTFVQPIHCPPPWMQQTFLGRVPVDLAVERFFEGCTKLASMLMSSEKVFGGDRLKRNRLLHFMILMCNALDSFLIPIPEEEAGAWEVFQVQVAEWRKKQLPWIKTLVDREGYTGMPPR